MSRGKESIRTIVTLLVVVALVNIGALIEASFGARAAVAVQRKEQAIVAAGLRLSDFPAGRWIGTPLPSKTGVDLGSRVVASCRTVATRTRGATSTRVLAYGESHEFVENADRFKVAVAAIGVYKTAAQAQRLLNNRRMPSMLDCFKQAATLNFASLSKSSGTPVHGSVRRLSVKPAGDGSFGFEIFTRTTITGGGDLGTLSVTTYEDFDLVRVGRAILVFFTLTHAPSSSAANAVREKILPVLVDRMRAAGA